MHAMQPTCFGLVCCQLMSEPYVEHKISTRGGAAMAHSVFHWGPLIALTLIAGISTATTFCALGLIPPAKQSLRIALLAPFWACVAGILVFFLKAIYTGAGAVPLNWLHNPSEVGHMLQFCQLCKHHKAPRSHHCHNWFATAGPRMRPISLFMRQLIVAVAFIRFGAVWLSFSWLGMLGLPPLTAASV